MFDCLVHIDDPSVNDPQAYLHNVAEAGVRDIILAGINPLNVPAKRWKETSTTPTIHRAYGLHPQAIDNFMLTAQLDALAERLGDQNVVAIGEIGIDDRPGMPALGVQEIVLRTQLQLAAVKNLPVILHLVGKSKMMLTLLKEAQRDSQKPLRGMLHAFSGPRELIRDFAKLNLYFSIGGHVLNPQHKKCRKTAAKIPEDRLLVETDYPQHADVPNELLLPQVLEELAHLRPKISGAPKEVDDASRLRVQRLADITSANAKRLFLKQDPS